MTKKQLKQKVQDYYQIIESQQIDPATMYLQSLVPTGRRSMQSLLKTSADIIGFEDKLEDMPWNIIEYQHLAIIRNTLQERGKSVNTINLTLFALRGVMKSCFNLGLINANQLMLLNDIKRVYGKRLPSGRSLSQSEIKKMYRACTQDKSTLGIRDYAIISTMLATGIRRSEVININVADYCTRSGLLNIQSGKGNKQRTTYLNTEGRRIIKKWLIVRGKLEGAIFNPISKSGTIINRQISSQAIYEIIRKRSDQAQIDPCKPHDLRRTFVTQLLEAGVDINITRQLAGHTDIQTTARYDLRDEKSQKKAIKRINMPG